MSVRVLIAGDRPLVRMGLAAVLAGDTTVECRGAITVAVLVSHLAREPPDVLLLDLDDLSVPALALISQVQPPIALAVCTDGVTFSPELLEAGVGGILTPAEVPDLLMLAIHAICAGRRFLSPVAVTALLAMDRRSLTATELRVAALLAQGHGTAGIAQEIGIDRRSAQNYITTLRRKLGCQERVQLAAWYQRYIAG